MNRLAKIMLVGLASTLSLLGGIVVAVTLVQVRTGDQVHRLLSYDYMSLVDSLAASGMGTMANDFFAGAAFLLVGSVLFTKIERTKRIARAVATGLLVFIAVTLVYACLNSRIGTSPF